MNIIDCAYPIVSDSPKSEIGLPWGDYQPRPCTIAVSY